jgi:hypothetical protein
MLAALLLAAAVNVSCGSDVHYDTVRRLSRCTLAAEAVVGTSRIPARSVVFIGANGGIEKAFLAHDTVIEGHLCQGDADNWETVFHPNGRLRLCWLAQDERIDGVSCRRATIWADVTGGSAGVHLSSDGHLQQCEAATAQRLGARTAKKGDTIRIDEHGTVSINGH